LKPVLRDTVEVRSDATKNIDKIGSEALSRSVEVHFLDADSHP
jgi:hypothetical protein